MPLCLVNGGIVCVCGGGGGTSEYEATMCIVLSHSVLRLTESWIYDFPLSNTHTHTHTHTQ